MPPPKLDHLLDGLERLRDFVNRHRPIFAMHEPAQKSQHEPQKANAENQREYERVCWLIEALTIYTQRADRGTGLVFVGLLGHYSSGKSSTINSLLQRDVQQTDQLPTDQGVTLITHPENRDAVAPFEQTGFAASLKIPIVAKSHDADWLRQVVLMDTPGSGDVDGTVPAGLLDEIVREFLPLCDVLVYCLNGAVPLDKADMPLLEKKQRELPHVPVLFVITRADEFRRDRHQLLSPENGLNPEKADSLRNRLRQRIEEALALAIKDPLAARAAVSAIPFLFVCNDGFHLGIDELRAQLVGRANDLAAGKLALHEHKVTYFASRAGDRWRHFQGELDTETGHARELHRKVHNNARHYQNPFKAQVNNLENHWRTCQSRFTESEKPPKDFPLKKAFALEDERLPTEGQDRWLEELERLAMTSGRSLSATVSVSVAGALRARFRDRLAGALNRMNPAEPAVAVEPLHADEIKGLARSLVLPAVQLWTEDSMSTRLDRLIDDLAKGCDRCAREHRGRLDSLQGLARSGVIDQTVATLAEAMGVVRKQILEEDYFSALRGHQVAVTGTDTFQAFARMPAVAAQLEALQQTPDETKQRAEAEAVVTCFLTDEDFAAVAQFGTHLGQLDQTLAGVMDRAPAAPPVRQLYQETRRKMEEADADPLWQAVSARLAVQHAAEVARHLEQAREKVAGHLRQVRQNAESAYQAYLDARQNADQTAQHAQERKRDAEAARRQHELARLEAELKRTELEQSQKNLERIHQTQATLRWLGVLAIGVIVLVVVGYGLGVWLGWFALLGATAWQAFVALIAAAPPLVLTPIGLFFGVSHYGRRITEAENRCDDADTKHKTANRAVELYAEHEQSAAGRAADATAVAETARKLAEERAQTLHRLMLPHAAGHGLARFSDDVLRECARLVQEAFTAYLDTDFRVEAELSEQFARELKRQVRLFLRTEALKAAEKFTQDLRQSAHDAVRLRDEVTTAIREASKKAQSLLVLDGDRAPRKVFDRLQERALKPSLDLVDQYLADWQKLQEELASLARQFSV